jgi:DNA replication factor GINS
MYDELHEIWKRELGSVELEKLTPDFYFRIADYLRRLREEGRMLDKKTVKAKLLKSEMHNVKRMASDLVRLRYSKLVRKLARGEKVSPEFLTVEEAKICTGCSPIIETYQSFVKNLLRGHVLNMDVAREHKSTVLRFLKDVPEIMGANMKAYGPFKVEDVASLPVENAKILVKQGLAEKVEVI